MLAAWLIGGLFALGCRTPLGSVSSSPAAVTLTIGVPQGRQSDLAVGIGQLPGRISVEGIVGIARDGRPIPMLAERWAPSPDGLSWQITLRKGVTFHDGSELRAEDVKASILADARNTDVTALRPALAEISDVEVTGVLELQIRVRRPTPFLVRDLDMGVIRTSSDGKQIGTGPFYTVSTTPDEIVMTAHRRYYRGAPLVDRVVLRRYDTLRTAWASMMRGEADFLWEVGQDALDFVRGESSVQLSSYLNPYVYAIVFNARQSGLDDPRIRRALNLAVDRQAIVEQAFKGRAVAAHLPIWPQDWAYDRALPAFAFDPEAAGALLRASVTPPRAKSTIAPRALVRFTCLVLENFAVDERVALIVQKQLSDAGVDMQLESIPTESLGARLAKGDFQAVMLAPLAGPRIIRQYPFWHSTVQPSRFNPWGYADTAVDAALESMRDAADEAAFREATMRFGRAMSENPPGIFLAWPEITQAVSRRFAVTFEPNRDAFYSIAQWRPVAPGGSED